MKIVKPSRLPNLYALPSLQTSFECALEIFPNGHCQKHSSQLQHMPGRSLSTISRCRQCPLSDAGSQFRHSDKTQRYQAFQPFRRIGRIERYIRRIISFSAVLDGAERQNACLHVSGAGGEAVASRAGSHANDGVLVTLEHEVRSSGAGVPELDTSVL